jgi:flagellar biosynthesis protein FliP
VKYSIQYLLLALVVAFMGTIWAAPCALADMKGPGISLNIQGLDGTEDYSLAIQIVILMTLLTVAPSILMLTTSFARIIIVLGFVRSALGLQQAPSNQLIVGLAFFLSLFLMGNVFDKIYTNAALPYIENKITSKDALDKGAGYLKDFMLKQTRAKDLEFFLGLSQGAEDASLPLTTVIPAFILSELKTAFQMGFMIFIPFLVIDFLVASVLMAMGMMMMPPAVLSLPFKILLFVLVDGWHLITQSIVQSFNM